MTQQATMICDMCGATVPREGHAVPKGWMHIEVWYRPTDSDGECSGCGGLDVCHRCLRHEGIGDALVNRAMADYDANVVRCDP